MAAGDVTFYNTGIKAAIVDGDWSADDHRLALATASYTPALTHDTWSDVSANECADGDYAQQDMTGETDNESSGTTTLDAADVSFGASVTITAKYAICIMGTVGAGAGGDSLVFYVDLNDGGGSVSSSSGPFDVNWNASGIATVAAA
jgi:hypothetical protein